MNFKIIYPVINKKMNFTISNATDYLPTNLTEPTNKIPITKMNFR